MQGHKHLQKQLILSVETTASLSRYHKPTECENKEEKTVMKEAQEGK